MIRTERCAEIFKALILNQTTKYDFLKYRGKLSNNQKTKRIRLFKPIMLKMRFKDDEECIDFFIFLITKYFRENHSISLFILDYMYEKMYFDYNVYVKSKNTFEYRFKDQLTSFLHKHTPKKLECAETVEAHSFDFDVIMTISNSIKLNWEESEDPLIVDYIKFIENMKGFYPKKTEVIKKQIIESLNNQ